MAHSRLGLRTRPGVIRSFTETQDALDNDAQFFIDQTAITDTTIIQAIDNLCKRLKTSEIWNKCWAIYPIVGGSASLHQYNLKSPYNLDSSFRLILSGGWSHSSSGMLGNGTNSFADTIIRADRLTRDSNHLAIYSRTASTSATTVEIGCADISTSNFLQIRSAVNYLAGNLVITNYSTTNTAAGFWVGSKINSSNRQAYYNGFSQNINTTNNTTNYPSINIYIGARNDNGVAAVYSDKQFAFASIGDGLTSSEINVYYNIVQEFQTILGRQV